MKDKLPAFSPFRLKWLRIAVELLQKFGITDKHVVYLWATVVGVLGAGVALLFEYLVELIQWGLTGVMEGGRVAVFCELGIERRILVPVIGGLIAGGDFAFSTQVCSDEIYGVYGSSVSG